MEDRRGKPPAEASEDELSERRHARQVAIDQQALNIIGLAQARTQLRAGRKATLTLRRRCPSCGSTVATVRPTAPHLRAVCARCGRTFRVPPAELGLREGEAQAKGRDDQEELQQSVSRHPSARGLPDRRPPRPTRPTDG